MENTCHCVGTPYTKRKITLKKGNICFLQCIDNMRNPLLSQESKEHGPGKKTIHIGSGETLLANIEKKEEERTIIS